MREAGFVHLHNHTEYSLLDGASRIKAMCDRAAELRMPALAITDHGNMFGAVEFYKTAQVKGVKPIVGCECYVAPGKLTDRTMNPDVPESSFHLTLLCENLEGYQNLVHLVSTGYLEGFYYRPRIDKELLAKHSKGLIAMSACLKGEVNYFLNRDDETRARAAATEYREIMGKDNFFLEVMRIGLPECRKVEAGAEAIGRELGLKLVATNDNHYLQRGDSEAHDVLICLQTGKRLKDRARMKFETQEVYLKSAEEMAKLFSDHPEYVSTTLDIAGRCNLMLETDGKKFSLPVFPRPPEYATDYEYLCKLAEEGLTRRYGERNLESGIGDRESGDSRFEIRDSRLTAARERQRYELGIIERMNFSGYFLIVKDIVDYARSKNIPVGPGRGSAVGSLVLYSLGITDVDPLRYGLIFERFLTTERVSLPDIDIDFADSRRGEVISYIRQRYGENCVAQIVTFGTMGAKAAVRDVGRVLDVPLSEVDRLAKLIPFDANLSKAQSQNRELKELVASNPEYQKLWQIALRLEGVARHASIHASGVVITPRPMMEFVPLHKTSDGETCTQYDMTSLESIGLLKMDVLGLRTLTVIEKAFELLRAEGIELDPSRIPLDDQATYDLLRRADVIGVFQLESGGMQNLLVKTRPDNLEDIMAVISLYRPGPMGNVDIDDYVARKNGGAAKPQLHPAMEDVLKDTHGVIVYQEQVMKVANLVAGFSLAEADRLRRVMAKKIPEQMVPMREKFVESAKKHGVAQKTADAVFNLIEPFAGYGFNKSHAAGYAVLSYITAYLKANYPIEFLTATLTSEIGNSDKLRKFVAEVRRMGLTLLGPDVNRSQYAFSIEPLTANGLRLTAETDEPMADGRQPSAVSEQQSAVSAQQSAVLSASPRLRVSASAPRAIRFGLGGIKNLGQGVCEGIVKERETKPFADYTDFIRRTRGFVNRKACESLIMAGAFDGFNPDRQALLEGLPDELQRAVSRRAALEERQTSLFGDTWNEAKATENGAELVRNGNATNALSPASGAAQAPVQQHHSFEKSALGFYLSSHPLEDFRLEIEALKCCPLERVGERDSDAAVAVAGVITGRKFKQDKRGRDYAILQLEDLSGTGEVMVFSQVLENSRKLAREDELVLILGKVRSRNEGQNTIWADAMYSLNEARGFLKSLTIQFKSGEVDERRLMDIRRVLEQYPGRAAVFFQIPEDGKNRVIRLRDVSVTPSTRLIREIKAFPLVRNSILSGGLPQR
jgi:DNA polymerase-3 subunit alpha